MIGACLTEIGERNAMNGLEKGSSLLGRLLLSLVVARGAGALSLDARRRV
jgi:uncharacterized membrane protein YphA (DoxX/SURF4 family)